MMLPAVIILEIMANTAAALSYILHVPFTLPLVKVPAAECMNLFITKDLCNWSCWPQDSALQQTNADETGEWILIICFGIVVQM